ncbi:MAG: RCC1 repeat-containing protein [Polyangiaceae bacterium]
MKRFLLALGFVAAIPFACTGNTPPTTSDGGICQPPVSETCSSCLSTSCSSQSAAAESDCAAVISSFCACNLGDTCCVEACGPAVSNACINDVIALASCGSGSCGGDCTVTVPGSCTPDAGAQDAAGSVSDASADADAAPVATDAGPTDASVTDAADASVPDATVTDSGVPTDAGDSGEDASVPGFGAAVQVSVGNATSCAVTATGGVVCWGSNPSGQLGNGTTTTSLIPTPVTGLTSGVASVSMGNGTACAVTTGGGVMCWGNGGTGQLGNNTQTNSLVPVQVVGLTSGVRMVSQGGDSACAITSGGGVVCWGAGGYGELGNGLGAASLVPVQVTGLTSGVTSLSVGISSACAVTAGGSVVCWGDNATGNLGNGSTTNSLVPVQVTGLTSGATSVSVGEYSSCAVTAGGGVMCWGYNADGELGNGTMTNSLVPVQVTGLTGGATSVSMGNETACATTTGGDVMCWGNPYAGSGSSVPVQVTGLTSGATSLSVGFLSSCVVVGCGVECWGDGWLGNDDDASVGSAVPLPVELLGASSCPAPGYGAAVSVSVGYDMSSACAVTASGAAVCWGDNVQGDLGNGAYNTPSASPVQVTGLTSGVTSVSVGTYAACALQNGGAWCWGYNNLGQLGNGSSATYISTPVQVTGLTSGVISVSMGYEAACAVTSAGAVMCWGDNGYGQLGTGGVGNSPTPVQVTGLTSGFVSVRMGSNNACAVTSGGDVMCWGDGSIDQLGNGGTSSLVPSQVTGLTSGATSVSIGAGNSACAVVSGGALCWGDNTYGQLGNNSTTEAPTPVAVSGLTSGVASVSVGEYSTCALTTGGGVFCWGYDEDGELGNSDGGTSQSQVPEQVTGLTSGVTALSAGAGSACAVVTCGGVDCWGGFPATSRVPAAVPLLGTSSCP